MCVFAELLRLSSTPRHSQFRTRRRRVLSPKASDDGIRIGRLAVFVIGANFNPVFSFIANVINDGFESITFDGAFEDIIDINPISKNAMRFVQRVGYPVKEEALRVTLRNVSTKRGMECRVVLRLVGVQTSLEFANAPVEQFIFVYDLRRLAFVRGVLRFTLGRRNVAVLRHRNRHLTFCQSAERAEFCNSVVLVNRSCRSR